MENIMISLADVTKTAAEMRRHNEQMMLELTEMKQIMNQLSANWQSPAAETIRARFNGMVPIFENYRDVVEGYAKFLDHTVTVYEATENSIHQNASSFQ